MFEALRGLDAWVTAFRRDSSPTRADAPFVEQYELEPGRWIVKVNPMANWTRATGVGLPARARPSAQPALRPRLHIDRLRAVHPAALRGRARARRPLGRACEVGVRHPAARDAARLGQATTQSASRASSISSLRWSPSESPSTCTGNALAR